jgi:hypothetical protein
MSETAREPASAPTRLRPSCHRCGAPLDDSLLASCPRCADCPRHPLGLRLGRLARPRLRTLLALVAVLAIALGWGVHVRRRRLADDSGQFYTHEEMAQYQAFLQAVALGQAREAERKAAAGGGEAPRWAEEAAEARARASAYARSRREYQWRAGLKRSRW